MQQSKRFYRPSQTLGRIENVIIIIIIINIVIIMQETDAEP